MDGSRVAEQFPRAIVTNTADEVFVGNGHSGGYQIRQFGSTGEEALPSEVFGLTPEPIGGSTGITIDSSNGTIYVADGPHDNVDVFDLVQLADVSTGGHSNEKGTTTTVAGTVNPEGVETQYFFEYGTSQSYEFRSPEETSSASASQQIAANLTELTPETTYHYRLVAVNANGTSNGQDGVFTTGPAVAGVVTGPASNIGITTATLHGELNPEGVGTVYFFQYGTTEGYGGLSEFEESSSEGPISPAAPIAELQPGTTYHYRLFTASEHGVTFGGDKTFTTLPALPTVNDLSPFATNVSLHEATLHDMISPGRGLTRYHIEYGATAEYGASTPESYTQFNEEEEAGTVYPVEQLIAGLAPGVTYHYAFVATNASGTTTGPDEVFTTLAGVPPAVETGVASNVSPNGATISGLVDPTGQFASYRFELGSGEGYATQVFGNIEQREIVTASFTGLLPGVTYHYRLVASDAAGVGMGADQTFTTPGLPTMIFQPGAPTLLAIPVFPLGPHVIKCKKGFVKKGAKCVRKPHPRHKKKGKKK